MGDLTQLEGMLDNRGRKDMKMPSFKSNTPKESPNKESRRDRLEDQAKKDFNLVIKNGMNKLNVVKEI